MSMVVLGKLNGLALLPSATLFYLLLNKFIKLELFLELQLLQLMILIPSAADVYEIATAAFLPCKN
jgi:hypothetical protein